jgi:ABC-type transporter Mla MlaB component
MLKITRTLETRSTATVKLEGKLMEPWVAEVLSACALPPGATSELTLDLSAVSFVDGAGVALLHGLLRRGVKVAACSHFIAELLNLENS